MIWQNKIKVERQNPDANFSIKVQFSDVLKGPITGQRFLDAKFGCFGYKTTFLIKYKMV